jgi:hypothetical protein
MQQQEQQLRFGFLPAQALQEINDLGQWKVRGAASCAVRASCMLQQLHLYSS